MHTAELHLISFFRLVTPILLIISLGRVSASAHPYHSDMDVYANIQVEPGKIKIDPDELAEFLDQLITERMEKYEVPSQAVSVVQDGKTIFTKGYGYADIERTVPVDPERTLFRIASVSKLFIWTAVMQLAEQNRVDLNADVNTYLDDFQIPETFPQPITLAHLMTHTAGFDKQDKGNLALSLEQVATPVEYLQGELPKRIFPPGRFHIYSNYGSNLAAYIVEQVTGMPFDDYIEENIFEPLGMNHSTSRQPLPPNLSGNMAVGYYWQTGFPFGERGEFEILPASGSITSTPMDMAKFMLAHLGAQRMGSQPILEKETISLMHATHFRFDPRLPGYTYGFFETYLNGQRLIFHNGGSPQFSANVTLIPEENIGLFEAYTGGKKGMGFLYEAFIDHYFPPVNIEVEEPVSFSIPDLQSFQGIYRTTLMSHTTFEKTIRLLDSGDRVTVNIDGSLNYQDNRWVRTGPLTFQMEGRPNLLIFQTKDGSLEGDIKFLLIDNKAFEKLKWYESQMFQIALLAVCLIIFILVGFGWPIAFLFKKDRGAPPGLSQRIGMWLCGLVCVLNIAFIAFFATQLFSAVFFGFTLLQKMIFLLPLLSILMSAISIAVMVLNLTREKSARPWNRSARLYVLLIATAGIAFTWWLNYWNLLGIPS